MSYDDDDDDDTDDDDDILAAFNAVFNAVNDLDLRVHKMGRGDEEAGLELVELEVGVRNSLRTLGRRSNRRQ